MLNLLVDLRDEFGLTYLFIAHGLNVVKHISGRVGVMYLGKLMEVATKQELYKNPLNPYTQALLSAIPSTDITHKKERIILKGDVPSPIDPGDGCRFSSRCFKALEGCDRIAPELRDIGGGHCVACRLYDGVQEKIMSERRLLLRQCHNKVWDLRFRRSLLLYEFIVSKNTFP